MLSVIQKDLTRVVHSRAVPSRRPVGDGLGRHGGLALREALRRLPGQVKKRH